MLSIIASVQATEGAITNDDFIHEPQTGSSKKAVKDEFEVGDAVSSWNTRGKAHEVSLQRVPGQTRNDDASLELGLRVRSSLLHHEAVKLLVEWFANLFLAQSLQKSIGGDTSDAPEKIRGDHEMQYRARFFHQPIHSYEIVRAYQSDVILNALYLCIGYDAPSLKHVCSRKDRCDVVKQGIPWRTINLEEFSAMTENLETAEWDGSQETESIIS